MNAAALILAVALTAEAPAVDFDTQVVPILTKSGCNAGSCHGAAAGRGGFRLSLLGSNPAVDYEHIVHELEGRRINLARPDESLVLAKPTEMLAHEGGLRFDYDGPQAALLTNWIQQGARRLQRRKLVRFEVTPRETIVEKLGTVVPIRATAFFSDGSQEDVARTTVFTSGDDSALRIDPAGNATVKRRGQHTAMLRYLDQVVAVRVIVPLSPKPVDLGAQPRRNFVDEAVLETLGTLRIPVSEPADDATLLRRTWLDLTGRLPPPEEVERYLSDKRPDKHRRLVDQLLAGDAYVDYWTLRWSQLFRVRSKAMQSEGARAFHGWLRKQVARNRPLDAMVRDMLLTTGDSYELGAANFSRATGNARDHAEFVSESLLGVRLRCANCHDHPLDRWTQDDYHGLSAIFARLERGRHVKIAARGDVTHPRTGEAAIPKIPAAAEFLSPAGDHRRELADWLVAGDNPLFARAMANRIWKQLMGRGLVEPVDDLRATNPATHPQLLDRLAREFVSEGYDVRHLLRLIANSAAYARSSEATDGNEADDRFYSHALVKPLEAEVLADALADVTGVPDKFGDLPAGTRAVALFDGQTPSPALDILGRCSREASCESGEPTGGLPLKLHLINGNLVNRKVTSDDGRLHQALAANRPDAELLKDFYLRALSRPPTRGEQDFWLKKLKSASGADHSAVWEDLVWGLVNCRAFQTNR